MIHVIIKRVNVGEPSLIGKNCIMNAQKFVWLEVFVR
jgi:hypothetical protein